MEQQQNMGLVSSLKHQYSPPSSTHTHMHKVMIRLLSQKWTRIHNIQTRQFASLNLKAETPQQQNMGLVSSRGKEVVSLTLKLLFLAGFQQSFSYPSTLRSIDLIRSKKVYKCSNSQSWTFLEN